MQQLFDFFVSAGVNFQVAIVTAIVTGVGVVVTALVAFLTAFINAWTRSQDRRHERRLKQVEELFAKRATHAEAIVQKLNDFHRTAFVYLSETSALAFNAVTFTGLADLETPNKLSKVQKSGNEQKQRINDWFSFECVRHYAWFSEAADISRNLDKLAEWYISFYDQIAYGLNDAFSYYSKYQELDKDGNLDSVEGRKFLNARFNAS